MIRTTVGGRWSSALLVVLALSAAACVAAPGALPAPSEGTEGPFVRTLDPAIPTVVIKDGLTLTVAVDRVSVAPGGPVRVTLALTNNRTTPVTYLDAGCGMHVLATAGLAVPVDPPGRDWTGISGQFKSEALADALGPGGVSYLEPYQRPLGPPCLDAGTNRDLAPGATVSGTGVWTANLTRSVPVVPGPVPVTFSVQYDPSPVPTPNPTTSHDAIQGSRTPSFKEIWVTSQITVVGSIAGVVSAGKAIDATLADARFAAWLGQQPSDTWSTINLYLDGDGWHVELFRDDRGALRNWAASIVDPRSGAVTSVDVCDSPCGR